MLTWQTLSYIYKINKFIHYNYSCWRSEHLEFIYHTFILLTKTTFTF